MAIATVQAGDWLTRTYAGRGKTMPIDKYFKGHGDEVMASIRKAHPDYSEKRVKAEFYATASAQNATPDEDKKAGQKAAFKKARKG